MKGYEESLFYGGKGKPWHPGGYKGGGGGGHGHWRPQRAPHDAGQADAKRIPVWNGSGETLRKYIQEVRWFVMGVKEEERKYAVARLLPGLSGSARQAAIKWSPSEFESGGGIELWLKRLSSLPTIQRAAPKAMAIVESYMELRRSGGETIGEYLVREEDGHQEFEEALDRLWQEALQDGTLQKMAVPAMERLQPVSAQNVRAPPATPARAAPTQREGSEEAPAGQLFPETTAQPAEPATPVRSGSSTPLPQPHVTALDTLASRCPETATSSSCSADIAFSDHSD